MMNGSLLFGCFILLHLFQVNSDDMDTISANQHIRDGETIISGGKIFELGFFSPGNSKNRYLGIWYHKISPPTVVWVANRDTPLHDTSGVFKVSNVGNLLLLNVADNVIWSSNSSGSIRNNIPVAQLLDTGNLIVRNESDVDHSNHIWQSFDYIGNTLLPGMKFGKDLVTGKQTQISSWKSLDDPSPGLYENWIDTNGYPQALQRQGSRLQYRFGPWNGLRFSGVGSKSPNPVYTYEFVINHKEVYLKIELVNNSILSRCYMSPEGDVVRLNWDDPTQGWIPYLSRTIDMCAQYGLCGPHGICSINSFPTCSCMEGFEALNPEEWSIGKWSSGCHRKKPLACDNEDGFLKFSGLKLPDTRLSWYKVNMSLAECETACKRKCSCTAYANLDVRGSGCLLWFGNLMDMRESDGNQDLYVRIAMVEPIDSSNLGLTSGSRNTKVIILAISTSVGLVLVGLTLAFCDSKKKGSRKRGNLVLAHGEDYSQTKEAELPSFSIGEIVKYTNHFSVRNKLGKGGFGSVYKGVKEDGRKIAVKRLSKTSTQGFNEFKNEVRFVARLQHRNLVKLLGYCTQGNEIILVYEYMPNRSLDKILFDKTRSLTLDWSHRFNIIQGIARGLVYLHQDSRLRIIHRDLKASNILLDSDMNPKISDFGLARRFKGYETRTKTKKCGWNLWLHLSRVCCAWGYFCKIRCI